MSTPSLQRRFVSALSTRRRRQALALTALMLVGAAAEIFTLGAVVPFLTLMASPEKAFEFAIVRTVSEALGWSAPTDLLLPVTILLVGVALLAGSVRVFLAWASNKYVYAIAFDLGIEVYRRTLYQPYTAHVRRNSSDIIAAMNKVQLVIGQVMLPAMQGIVAVVIALAILSALIIIDPLVAGGAGLGFGVAYVGISLYARRRLRRNSLLIAEKQSRRVQAVQEGLGGIRDVLLDGSQPLYVARYAAHDGPLRNAQATNNIISSLPKYLLESLGMILIVLLAYAISLRDGGLVGALPVLGVLALGAQRLVPLMQQVYLGWAKVVGNHGMLADVLDLAEQPVATEWMEQQPADVLPFAEAIRIDQLSFSYSPGAEPVLQQIDLHIPRGASVGFVGATGSGKSTLIDVLMGLLEPTQGQVRVDELPLGDHNRRAWQGRIAHVPQAIFLADATVEENIALGVPPAQIDHARVAQVIRLAQAEEFIQAMPQGLKSIVGERGVRLSGGQRQRLGIARALYKRADVLVLDEATSALDDATEKAVMRGLSALAEQKTILMIAHRISTLADCDFVVRLDAGRIVEVGPPAQVLGSELVSAAEAPAEQEARA